MSDAFDGDAISRADREFLASLGEHPLRRNPLYGVAVPAAARLTGRFDPNDKEQTAERPSASRAVLDWMLVNYAYHDRRLHGQRRHHLAGRRRDHHDRETCAASCSPTRSSTEGPRGGLKKTSVVDVWMMHPQRARSTRSRRRPDQPRPTFTEDGLIVYNRYWPPAHPTSGGELATFETFFARLVPDDDGTGHGSGTGSPTRRAGRGCRWSR